MERRHGFSVDLGDLLALVEADPFLRLLGVSVESPGPGLCEARAEFREELTRFGGTMNGGAVAALMDAAGGCAALTRELGRNEVTVDLFISYLRPVSSGPVRARARVTKWGRTLAFVELELLDGSGRACAEGRGTYMYLDVKR
ncbi:MAG: PaaI family thioesterase [Nitrososphaeria archaeon]